MPDAPATMDPTEPTRPTPPPEQTAADLRRLGYHAAAEDGWVLLDPESADAVLGILLNLRYSLPSRAP